MSDLAQRLPWLIPATIALSAGCGQRIGDACKVPINCGVQQVRQCDVSNADLDISGDGECTIEGCTRGSCPNEAVCVRVYTSDFLSVACDPAREDVPSLECEDDSDCGSLGCTAGVCGSPPNECAAYEICLPEGLCADEASARSSCRLECKRENQCRRDGYQCKAIGTDGVYLAPATDDPTLGGDKSICVFTPPPA